MAVMMNSVFSVDINGNSSLGDCTNISVINTFDSIDIKWTDPQDVIFNDSIITQWKGTKLIRKEDAYPTNEKDGVTVVDSTIRNKYSAVAFKDTDVISDKVYYYCLFPYTDNGVSLSDKNRFTGKRVTFDPILKNNTWSKIEQASEMGIASQIWQIGDEIDLKLSGAFNETITLQIWGFNHFDKSDGSGKAGICFGMKGVFDRTYKMVDTYDRDSTPDWTISRIRKNDMVNLLNSVPPELKNIIKTVILQSCAIRNSDGSIVTVSSQDKIFIPGATELGISRGYDGNQKKLPIFTDNKSRVKKISNGTDVSYWTRSAVDGKWSNSYSIADKDGSWSTCLIGQFDSGTSYTHSCHMCVMFNI